MSILMFSLELGSFLENHTSSSSNQMSNPPDIHQRRFQFVFRMLSAGKSGMLEQLGILEPVKDVIEWVNSFVIMEKKVTIDSSNTHSPGHSVSKKLRICLDSRDLHEALEREPYYTWSIEEILGKFHGINKFTIADFNKGYWMVELHPESRKLTTMALDIGRF